MSLPEPPGQPPPSTEQRSRFWAFAIPVVTFLIGVGVGVAGAPDDEAPAPVAVPPAESEDLTGAISPTPSPSPSPTEAPVVDGTWVLTACDLQLFTQGNNSTLVAAIEVENTGNVPADVTVGLKWDALPGPLFDGGTKVVTLEPGRSKEVRFQTNIGISDVDRVQSSPGYQSVNDNKFCKVKASIDQA